MAEQLQRGQARRTFLGTIGAALLTLTLASCIPGSAPRPGPITPEAAPEAERPAPALPKDEIRNRVAVLVPLSGANAGVGRSIANAANLALLDTGGDTIRLTVYDTAKGAGVAANTAIAEGNGLILGPLLAEDVRLVAPIARKAGVPVISFSNDSSVAGDGVYLMGFTPTQSIDRVVAHARSQGLNRFAGLTPDGIYGRRSSQALIDAVERTGGRMVAMQTFARNPAALTAAVGKLNAQSGYDAVLIADSGKIAATAAAAVRNGPSKDARILGTELWKTESNLATLTPLRGAWFAAVPDAMFNQLRTRYRARYKVSPYRLGSLGYDATLLAVRVAKDWKLGRPFPEKELINPEGFTGIDGAFRFGKDGIADRMLEVQQINVDGVATISPALKGFDR